MTQIINEGWKLSSLIIGRSYNRSDTQSYTGKIRFTNNKEDELAFSIPPDKLVQILELISDSIVSSARELGAGLVASVQKQVQAPPEEQQALPSNSPDSQLTQAGDLPF